MYAIIVHHFIYYGFMEKKYSKYPQIGLINILCFWHVSSFALISEIIGYKSAKYSNLIHSWLVAFFYSFGIFVLIRKYKPSFINKKTDFLYQYCFPVIFIKYWYFTQYFGMYLFLPVVNKGISYLTKLELKILAFSTISIYIIWHDIINPTIDSFHMAKGYSVLWLLIYYLTGAYIGKYRIKYNGIKKVVFCFICIFLFISSTLICYKLKYYVIPKNDSFKNKIMLSLKSLFERRISSFPMIIQSISITLFSMQLNYNKYIAKIISFLGPLTFGVYLSHNHPLLKWNYTGKMVKNKSDHLPLNYIIKWLLINSLKFSGVCLSIDYIRSLIFNILRVRKLCILIENLIFKIFKLFT